MEVLSLIFGYLTILLGILASIATLFFMIANFGIEDKRTTTGWKDNIRPDSVFGIFLIATILWICTFFLSKISTLPSWLEPVIYVLGIIGEVIKMLPVLWENMF